MYRLNTPKLLKQITPPHRRTPKRKRVLEVLLHGLTLLWNRAEKQGRVDKLLAVFVPNKRVLEFHCERVTGLASGVITVELDVVPGTNISGYGFRFPADLNSEKIDALYDLIRTLNITNWYETRY